MTGLKTGSPMRTLGEKRRAAGAKGRASRTHRDGLLQLTMLSYGYIAPSEAADVLNRNRATLHTWVGECKVESVTVGVENRVFIELASLIAHVGPTEHGVEKLRTLLASKRKEWTGTVSP